MDLELSNGLTIPASELQWRFSRSSGPGGQHVNASDSRVELSWAFASSRALTDAQLLRLRSRLSSKFAGEVITIASSEQRSQLRNREIALERLAGLVEAALAPDAPERRPTRPTKGSIRRHSAAKTQRSATKKLRQRPMSEE